MNFDPFGKGRHIYTFTNTCIEDTSVLLEDETYKVFLNIKGNIDDTDEEMVEFVGDVENSTSEYVAHTKSKLVKESHQKVVAVKEDKRMEAEYLTLLERDRQKFEEGIEQGIELERKLLVRNMLVVNVSIEDIARFIKLPIEEIRKIKEDKN